MLIGAGTGALGGLLTGKDPLKGALMGGVTGGLLNAIPTAAFGAGGIGAGAASATSAGATGLVGASNPILGAGLSGGIGAVSTPLMSTIPTEGVNAFLEPTMQTSGIVGSTGELGANMGLINPMTNASNEVLASRIPNMGVDAFTQQPSMFESFYDKVKPYVDVRDLGSTALKSQLQSQQRQVPTSQSGQVSRGQAPQANDVMALLQAMKMPERRRISLI